MRTHVKFTCLNEIETVYERLRVNVKVERGFCLLRIRDLPYIVSILFAHGTFTCTHGKITRQWKSTLRDRKKGEWVRGAGLKVHVIYESYYMVEFELQHIY